LTTIQSFSLRTFALTFVRLHVYMFIMKLKSPDSVSAIYKQIFNNFE